MSERQFNNYLFFVVLLSTMIDGAFVDAVHYLSTFVFIVMALPELPEPKEYKKRVDNGVKTAVECFVIMNGVMLSTKQIKKKKPTPTK